MDAPRDRAIVAPKAKPVPLIVDVEGMGEEQLGSVQRLWGIIQKRLAQKTVSNTELKQLIEGMS